MREKLFVYDRENTSKEVFNSLSETNREKIKEFKDYLLISAGEIRAGEGVREVIRFARVVGEELNEVDLDDERYFLKEVKTSAFGDYTKNKIKDFVHRFLRWSFKDWSERFDEFRDFKINTDAQRVKPITSKEIIKKEDFERLMKNEKSLFWKTFLIVQYEGGLRTGEVRNLEWDKVDFEEDDFTSLNIPCKKNRNGTIKIRTLPLKEATYYLQELKKQQEISGIKTKWVFPSPQNPKRPISKAVNLWFNRLTKKVLGKTSYNYLLRHSRGTELKRIVKEGGMSKDNATEFMGHSEEMFDKVYSHIDKEDIKEMLKKQIYNFEYIPEEKKHELERQVELLQENQKLQEKISMAQNRLLIKTTLQNKDLTPKERKDFEMLQGRLK